MTRPRFIDGKVTFRYPSGPRPCRVDGCEAPARRRGMCDKHYHRWWRHGDPQANHRKNQYECQQGHPWTPETTRIVRGSDGRTRRRCRICERAWAREYYHAMKGVRAA